jgi:hypothetical protein
MIKSAFKVTLTAITSALVCGPAAALDARSLSLGGSAIANGYGVHGALENPASLMTQQRADLSVHVHFGGNVDLRDDVGLAETITDNEDLAQDIEDEIEQLSGQTIQCLNSLDDPNAICLSGTESIGQLAADVNEVLNLADGNTIVGSGGLDFGVGYTQTTIPFVVHLHTTVVASGIPNVATGDIAYINQFEEALSDGNLTVGEIENNDAFSVAEDGTLAVVQPEEVLQSEIEGAALIRSQVGVSIARTFDIGGKPFDIGITPKVSALRAASLNASVADNFDEQAESLKDQFSDSESDATSFTADIGIALPLDHTPLAIAAVVRNVIPENVETGNGFKIETTPQLVVGTAYAFGPVVLNADLALNKAKIDNFETQIISVGAEFTTAFLNLRAGLSHDVERNIDPTALTLGFGLGPLQMGARLAGDSVTSFTSQISAQLSYSF